MRGADVMVTPTTPPILVLSGERFSPGVHINASPPLRALGGPGPTGNPLPSAWVRMYVWRRDRGRCVRCGGQKRVWFEYVIQVVRAGDSNTEQNIRLMCGRCSHGAGASGRRKRRRS